jgi:hypothetical protein
MEAKGTVNDSGLEQYDHVVVMVNDEDKNYPIGIGFADKDGDVHAYVALDLATANLFGETFCQRFNETLQKVRGDQ